MKIVRSVVNKYSFISNFYIFMHFCLIILTKYSSKILNRSGKVSKYIVYFQLQWESIQYFTIKYVISCVFCGYTLC